MNPELFQNWPFGNEGDEVDIRAEDISGAALRIVGGTSGIAGGTESRLEWWKMEGLDESVILVGLKTVAIG